MKFDEIPLPDWFSRFNWGEPEDLTTNIDEMWSAENFVDRERFLVNLLQDSGNSISLDFVKGIEMELSDPFGLLDTLDAASLWAGLNISRRKFTQEEMEFFHEVAWTTWEAGALAGMAVFETGTRFSGSIEYSLPFGSLFVFLVFSGFNLRENELQPVIWDERRRSVLVDTLNDLTPGEIGTWEFSPGAVGWGSLGKYRDYLELAQHWSSFPNWSGYRRPEHVAEALFFGPTGPPSANKKRHDLPGGHSFLTTPNWPVHQRISDFKG